MVDPLNNPPRDIAPLPMDRASDAREERAVPARLRGAPWALVALLLAAIVWLSWEAFGPLDLGDPVATSLAAFERHNELTVFSAQLSPVVAAEDSRYLDLLQSRQVAVIPATVRYTLDMSAIDADDMVWDGVNRKLAITLPDLTISKPDLDEARAQYLREGIWITREAQDQLNRQNTMLAEQMARDAAQEPALMELARAAARDAVEQNLAIPLRAAGFGEVTVAVRFTQNDRLTP